MVKRHNEKDLSQKIKNGIVFRLKTKTRKNGNISALKSTAKFEKKE
jgi:hypothetical protein